MTQNRSNHPSKKPLRPAEGAWIRDGRSGLCGICESTTVQTVFARTLAGTPFTARRDDVCVLSPDAANEAVHTPPVRSITERSKGVQMSRLPQVREGHTVEHVDERLRGEYPAGRVVLTGVGMVSVQPANGAPKWTVDRYDVRHLDEDQQAD